MKKAKILNPIIEALMCFAAPSLNPDDFVELERITSKLCEHYEKVDFNASNPEPFIDNCKVQS